jgi:hypothetical protein
MVSQDQYLDRFQQRARERAFDWRRNRAATRKKAWIMGKSFAAGARQPDHQQERL